MARWTGWRKIADRGGWYGESLDWDGPACYKLAIAGPRGGGLQIKYVGETGNERKRVVAYAQNGSHLSEIIYQALADGWCLYYRAHKAKSKTDAKRMQDNLLAHWAYDWNTRLSTWGK